MCCCCYGCRSLIDADDPQSFALNENGQPVDKRNEHSVEYGRSWKSTMKESAHEEPVRFCTACVCLPCAISDLRRTMLKSEGGTYGCCQGFHPLGVFLGEKRAASLLLGYDYWCCQRLEPAWAKQVSMLEGNCCEGGSFVCEAQGLCLEVCCCPCFALASTRAYVMERRRIAPDPVDNKLMLFFNR